MALPITGNQNLPTSRQIPDHSIMDHFNKQVYLGNGFILTRDAVSIADTSETGIFLIVNPTTSGNTKSLFISRKMVICETASQSAILRVYMAPTAVAGAAAPSRNARRASSNTSVATSTIVTSFSAGGTLYEVLSSPTSVPDRSSEMIIVDPGQTMLVTVQCSAAATIAASLSWYEL